MKKSGSRLLYRKIAIIILIIGISLVIFGIYLSQTFYKEKNPNINIPNQNIDNQDDDIENSDNYVPLEEGVLLEKFKITETKGKNGNDLLYLTFEILNNSSNDIKNKLLKINIYDNDNIVKEYEYEITELNINDEVAIETNLYLSHKNTYKYEVIFDDKITNIDLNNLKIYKID